MRQESGPRAGRTSAPVAARVLAVAALALACGGAWAHFPPGVEYKVFQFPTDRLPTIDADTADWEAVPAEYTVDGSKLSDTVMGHGPDMDPESLRVEVTVGWSPHTNRLYFLYKVWDDIHNFAFRTFPKGDIFEVVLDADHSGGRYHTYADVTPEVEARLKSAQCQNYHIFTPPAEGMAWAWVWGEQQWLVDAPWSERAYAYDFALGEPGPLVLEFSLTAFNYASYLGAEHSAVHRLVEAEVVGLSWSVLDYDKSDDQYEGFWNLSHHTRMDRTADLLPNFRLMPLEGPVAP